MKPPTVHKVLHMLVHFSSLALILEADLGLFDGPKTTFNSPANSNF